jgi:hypothetical protein
MALTSQAIVVQHELLERMRDARDRSDEMFSLVREDSLYDRPIAERHRLIFYIGHLEAFDWNLLSERALSERSFHPEFDRLFAFGIDPVGSALPTDRPSDWPRLDKVREYVDRVRTVLDRKLDAILAPGLRAGSKLNTLLNVAIEHRLLKRSPISFINCHTRRRSEEVCPRNA